MTKEERKEYNKQHYLKNKEKKQNQYREFVDSLTEEQLEQERQRRHAVYINKRYGVFLENNFENNLKINLKLNLIFILSCRTHQRLRTL